MLYKHREQQEHIYIDIPCYRPRCSLLHEILTKHLLQAQVTFDENHELKLLTKLRSYRPSYICAL